MQLFVLYTAIVPGAKLATAKNLPLGEYAGALGPNPGKYGEPIVCDNIH